MNQSKITILFFGQLAEQTGVSKLEWARYQSTDEVLEALHIKYPLLSHKQYQVALDKEILNENALLTQDHVIALLPPYAGG